MESAQTHKIIESWQEETAKKLGRLRAVHERVEEALRACKKRLELLDQLKDLENEIKVSDIEEVLTEVSDFDEETLAEETQAEDGSRTSFNPPTDGTMSDKVEAWFRQKQRVAQPKEIEKDLRRFEPGIRDNAVSETTSRMYNRDGTLWRRKYEQDKTSYFYGLSEWVEEERDEKDFAPEFVPEELRNDSRLNL